MVWIKICGITDIYDARQIASAGADALGFILSTNSPRRVSDEKFISIAGHLRKNSPLETDSELKVSIFPGGASHKKHPAIVGVFVNEKIERIHGLLDENLLDFIQFSGDEDKDYLKKIKNMESAGSDKNSKFNKNSQNSKSDRNNKSGRNSTKIIKLIRISGSAKRETFYQEMFSLQKYADFFLLDTFNAGFYGGTGQVFNWHLVKDIGKDFPVIIAGGLNSHNVKEALRIVKPFGVDASSGLEICPGKKDIEKTKEFIMRARDL